MSFADLQVVQIPNKGRGIVASRSFSPGDIVESCPVIVVPDEAVVGIWECYCFLWDETNSALALGYGSLYNHSRNNNCIHRQNIEGRTIDIIAIKNIEVGEELTIHYSCELWFVES